MIFVVSLITLACNRLKARKTDKAKDEEESLHGLWSLPGSSDDIPFDTRRGVQTDGIWLNDDNTPYTIPAQPRTRDERQTEDHDSPLAVRSTSPIQLAEPRDDDNRESKAVICEAPAPPVVMPVRKVRFCDPKSRDSGRDDENEAMVQQRTTGLEPKSK